MQYFKRLKSNVDTAPFLAEIESVSKAWDAATGRQDKIAVQREAKAIPLRGLRKSAIKGRERRDVHESRWPAGSRNKACINAVDVEADIDAVCAVHRSF